MDHVLHRAEENVFLARLRPQQQRRQRWGKGERVESGDADGERDGQRELLIQQSRGSGKKRYRHEHSDQH